MAGVTLAQVAARAGVSQPTASRVLNGSSRTPAPHVVEAVRKAADELGYIVNAQAQALVRSTSGLLGLVVHDIADPYFSVVAAGVQEAAHAHGRHLMLAVTMQDPSQELAAAQVFIAHRADAIVLTGSRWTGRQAAPIQRRLEADLGRYVEAGGHVSVIGEPVPGAHAVVPENRRAATSLARALVAEGGRDFIVLSGPPDLVTAVERTRGFVSGLAKEGIQPRAVVSGGFTRDGGFEAMQEAMALVKNPGPASPCVFAVTDVMALGAVAALRDAQLVVPDDVRVAGFDDIPTLRDHSPGLTTVRLPLKQMGVDAAEFALGERQEQPVVRRVKGEVVLRESTRLHRLAAEGAARGVGATASTPATE